MAWMQVSFFSNVLRRIVPLNILIPADASKTEKKYKTLYLLHGYGGNCNDWLIEGNAHALSQQFDLCIVMPNGNNDFYVDSPRSGKNMDAFIALELVAFTRRLLPLSDKREDTLVAGLSMGGFGALHLALSHSDIFGCCIALSSPMVLEHEILDNMPEEPVFMGISRGYYKEVFGENLEKLPESDYNPRVLAEKLIKSGKTLPELYIACGANDMLKDGNRAFSEYLDSIGFAHIYEEGSGTHEWAFWKPYIGRGLEHFIKPKEHAKLPFWVEADTFERGDR